MERTEVLQLMGALKLYGMRSAYDEIMGVAIKRQHEPPKIVGDLLQAEISEKQARSIKYQLTVAKLPLGVVTRAMLPFFVALFVVLMMVTYIPWISLWLPSTMG